MEEVQDLELSSLGHTWILDLDGTILRHNGYLLDGKDSFLSGAKEFIASIPPEDIIIFLTSRKKEFACITEKYLADNNIIYNHIIYEAPYGERIIINDKKESGLETAKAINLDRNVFQKFNILINKKL